MMELGLQHEVKIIGFKEGLAKDFARLNYEWIEENFAIEDHDRLMLEHSFEFIINPGGQIFFASQSGEMVGTVALINVDQESFELAKMAVTAKSRGLKIGDKLMAACLEHAKTAGKKRIFLLSNTKLIPAINLYRKTGFREIPLDPKTPYQRTNIQMELLLEQALV